MLTNTGAKVGEENSTRGNAAQKPLPEGGGSSTEPGVLIGAKVWWRQWAPLDRMAVGTFIEKFVMQEERRAAILTTGTTAVAAARATRTAAAAATPAKGEVVAATEEALAAAMAVETSGKEGVRAATATSRVDVWRTR